MPAHVTRGALVAHRHTLAPPRGRTSQYQPVVEFVEWWTARLEVLGSNPRARFLLLEQKPVLYQEGSGMVETYSLYS